MSEPIEFRVTLDEPIQFSLATGPQGPAGKKGDPGTTDYNQLENKPDLTTFYKKTEADERFVAKEEGKGLSSNDYTNAEKTKLAGIAKGAEKNLPVDTELSETSKNAVENKAITVAVNSKANQAEVDELSSDTEDILNALTTTDRGSNLNLKHTVDSKIRGVKLLGDTTQAKFSGKNLLETKNSERTINGVKFTPLADGRVRAVGTATANATYPLNTETESNAKNIPLSAGVYTINGFDDGVALLQAWYSEKGEETKYSLNKIELSKDGVCGAYLRIKSGKFVNKIFSPQIERGDKATDWEPYVGVQPSPNPDYPQEVKTVSGEQVVEVCGKNLIDISTLANGYVDTVGRLNPSHPLGEMHSGFIKVKPNTTYTFSIIKKTLTNPQWFGVGEYSDNSIDNFIKRNTKADTTDNNIVFTTTATTQYIIVSARNLIGATEVQLEVSSMTTEYEPYQGATYSINLGSLELYKLGDYQDRIFYDKGWKLEKKVGKMIFNGSQNIVEANRQVDGFYRTYYVINGAVNDGGIDDVIPYASDKFTCFTTNQPETIEGVRKNIAYNVPLITFTVKESRLTVNTAAAMKRWFEKNPTTVYYRLAAPAIASITDQNLIRQLDELRKARVFDRNTNILSSCNIEVDTLVNVGWLRDK